MPLIYFLVTLFATTIGGIAGVGGGIIIKPTLDAIGTYNVATIGVLSSITVLSMATVSCYKYLKIGIKFDNRIILLSTGSILGGFFGKSMFDLLSNNVSNNIAKGIQASMLIALFVFVLFRKYYPHYKTENKVVMILAGVLMGSLSSFLGIGGGPINIVIICIIFSLQVKDAAVFSIFTIFFSQLTTVITTTVSPGLNTFELSMLLLMIPAAIIGGIVGTHLNRKLVHKHIEGLFNALIGSMILLSLYNVYVSFFM